MHILFIADPLESFKTYKDTTFAMMRELQKRGHTLAACEPQDIAWERGGLVTAVVRNIRLTGAADDWFSVASDTPGATSVALTDHGAVRLRKAPPLAS